MKIRALSYALAASVLALSLSACGGDDEGGDDGTATDNGLELINSGQLTVCSDIPYPPFEMEAGGDYTGFDMDLMKEIAQGLDLELAVQDSGFDGLQSGLSLNSGQCDVVASAMTITDEREQKIDFTDPYYDSEQSLLVPTGSDITSIDDLAGKRVGVQQGTTGKTYTEQNAPEGTDIASFPSDAEMYTAIKAGQVDALLQDLPVNVEHVKDGGYEIVEQYSTDEQYGFAVKEEGADNLLAALNEQLTALRDSGRYDEIYNSYFSAK